MPTPRLLALTAAIALTLAAPAAIAAPTAGYQLPPKALVDLVDAPLTPGLSLSPDKRTMLYLERRPLLGIADLAKPELKLAGLSLDPTTFGPSRTNGYRGIRLQAFPDGAITAAKGLPANAKITTVTWSPDSRQVAFSVTGKSGIYLWVMDGKTGVARQLSKLKLNAVSGAPFHWLPDSKGLVVRTVPDRRGAAPQAPKRPDGPVIQENAGIKAPARTYPDLLKTPHDERLLEYYLESRVMVIGLDGRHRAVGQPGLYVAVEPSPDGKHLLVEAIHRPFSYLVPLSRFPLQSAVWSLEGKAIATVADLPLAENVPISFDATRTGRRGIHWRGDAPATLAWAEAQDQGDPAVKTNVRDAVFVWSAPFAGQPEKLAVLESRFTGVTWGHDGLALVSEGWWKTRRERTWAVKPGKPGTPLQKVFDRSSEDAYGDPGAPAIKINAQGFPVLRTSEGGQAILLTGEGASPEGNRPFLDRLNLATGKSERLWRSEAPTYAYVSRFLDDDGSRFVISRESPTAPPNFYLKDRKAGSEKQLTRFPNPQAALNGITKELITYTRADGVKLSGTLYLPAGYQKGQGTLPMLMWAYPQEFKSADAAGQITESPYRFDRIYTGSPLFWLTQGYAVLDDPKLPIIGAGEAEPNDSYVEQLVSGAQAAVDEVVRRGVADRHRIAIGGHSYGAFMTANLLAHSDLFAAGIARSGAYNRTLTPFGFQSEERTLWDVPGVYVKMSPFVAANKINEPLLLIHGMEDPNPGTFPMQSERLYQAIKGLGGRARLVMLPYEGHGYQARESVLHVLAEMTRWLDVNVKERKAPEEGRRP